MLQPLIEDPIPSHYNQEVSSPGLDRPLFTTAQLARFAGEQATVSVYAPVDGRRKFKGTILAAGEDTVTIEQDGAEVVLELSNVVRARLVPDYDAILAESRNRD